MRFNLRLEFMLFLRNRISKSCLHVTNLADVLSLSDPFRVLATATTVLVLLISLFIRALGGRHSTGTNCKSGSHIDTGDLAGASIFSIPAAGDFDGDGTLDLIITTEHLGEGVRYYRGIDSSVGKRVFEPGIAVTLPITPLAGIDWNQDLPTDILLLGDGTATEAGNKGISLAVCQGGNPPVFESPRILRKSEACKRC